MDTLGFKLKTEDAGGYSFLKSALSNSLSNIYEGINRHGKFIGGNIKNIRCGVTEKCLTIEGSIAKYYHNNNIDGLNYYDLCSALSQLESDLSVNIKPALLYRIDFSNTFEMLDPPKSYFPYLIACEGMERCTFGTTILFKQKARETTYYDKGIEQFGRNTSKRLMRYEHRMLYPSAISKLFITKRINLKSLSDKNFYNTLVQNWANQHFKIAKQKTNMRLFEEKEFYNRQGLKDALEEFAILHIGADNLLSLIDSRHKEGTIGNGVSASRMKKYILDAVNNLPLEENERSKMQELDNKIIESVTKFSI